jgi:hypothetical protein
MLPRPLRLRWSRFGIDRLAYLDRWPIEQAAGGLVGRHQRLDGGAQFRLAGAGFLQKVGALACGFRQGFVKESFFAHDSSPARTAWLHIPMRRTRPSGTRNLGKIIFAAGVAIVFREMPRMPARESPEEQSLPDCGRPASSGLT